MLLYACFLLPLLSAVLTSYEAEFHELLTHFGLVHNLEDQIPEYEIVIPLSHNRYQRSIEGHPHEQFFTLNAFGEQIQLDLQKSKSFSGKTIKIVSRNEDGSVVEVMTPIEDCLYRGTSVTHAGSAVAVSTCDGLSGVIRTTSGDLIIQPVPESLRQKRNLHEDAHIIYKRQPTGEKHCAVDRSPFAMYQTRSGGASNVANARQLIVETAAFVDYALYKHFNDEKKLLDFVACLFNAIELLYNHPSLLPIPINFVLRRLDIFKTDRASFQITEDGERFLDSFCLWQNKINPGTDADKDHWDHAFMLTGLDIHAGGSSGVIGIAPLNGMCTGKRSCTLTEARFFQGAFTGAHEAGHNFGMEHDGDGNRCDAHKFVMAPMDEEGQVTWSTCSRDYLQNYLKNPWCDCLLDDGGEGVFNHAADKRLPGQRSDAMHQCQLGFGPNFHPVENAQTDICFILKCSDGYYVSKAHPALEGTYCAPGSWCKSGRCTSWGNNGPRPVNGGWSQWSPWSECESSCLRGGKGVSKSTRHCDNPRPANGGQKCQGDGLQSKYCDDSFCKTRLSNEDYASRVCSNAPGNIRPNVNGLGAQLYHDDTGGCAVWCEKRGQRGQYTGWDARFPDGTDCSQGKGNAFCVSGSCKRNGYRHVPEKRELKTPHWDVSPWGSCSKECDTGVQTRIVQCVVDWIDNVQKVIPNFECEKIEPQPSSEMECNVQLCVQGIPRKTRELKTPRWEIYEWGPCSAECDGGIQERIVQCVIDWKEGIKKIIPDIQCHALNEPIPEKQQVCNEQLCVQGIPKKQNQYIVPNWEMSDWTECSKPCGSGTQRRTIKCMIVWQGKPMEIFMSECDKAYGRPPNVQKCNTQACEAVPRKNNQYTVPNWEMSDWTECSKPCGGGTQSRTIKCMIVWQGRQMETLMSECDKAYGRPPRVQKCNTQDCEAAPIESRKVIIPQWQYSEWSSCSKECGGGIQTRTIKCMIQWQGQPKETFMSECDKAYGRPPTTQQCNIQDC